MMCTDTWATKEVSLSFLTLFCFSCNISQTITSYIGDHPLYPPPPAYVPQPELNKNTLVPEVKVPTVSEDVAREALLKFVESKWRYSSKPARNMVFKQLKPITVYRVVDGPQYGASPPPWDIPLMLPQRYSDRVEKTRVPHSSFVKMCHKCNGCGRTRCVGCHGRGQKRCPFCHGHGASPAMGWAIRPALYVRAVRTCCTPSSSRKNNISNFIPDRQPDFPDKNFENVSGDPFFIDESNLVYPIQGFPDQEICDVSTKMINEHYGRFSSTSRILQQRQTIELVPLTHAIYTYSGKDFSFFVYGGRT
ncbi:hypothetical protein F7725_016349, partial [Dissostichus mawsoni]